MPRGEPRRHLLGAGSHGICGLLIINADDWGRDVQTTNTILVCAGMRSISAVSAMVFMEDSDRAAALSREHGIDAGLHLNLDTVFTARSVDGRLLEHQAKLAAFLRHSLSRPFFHPGLRQSFEYVVRAQLREYERLYGAAPARIDGHHHQHLSANVLLGGLLPVGAVLRPHFSREQGEKAVRNSVFRWYSKVMLARRYRSVDYLFALPPLAPARLMRVFGRSREASIEVETHPVNRAELEFLTGGGLRQMLGDTQVSRNHLKLS